MDSDRGMTAAEIAAGMDALVAGVQRKISEGLDESLGLAILCTEHMATAVAVISQGHPELGSELTQRAAGFAVQHRAIRIASRAGAVPDDISSLGAGESG